MKQAVQNLGKPTTVLTIGAVGVITILGIRWYQKRLKNAVPTEWNSVGKVKSLYIYPLKSGAKIELTTGFCTEIGIRMTQEDSYQLYDRSLVVYTENDNELRTSRTYPKLLFIEVTPYDANHFIMTGPDMAPLKVKIPDINEPNLRTSNIKWWRGEIIFTIDCGDEAAKWVSQYIFEKDFSLRLGFYDVQRRRDISRSHQNHFSVYPFLRSEATGTYTDLSSYHIINQASVNELCNRLPQHDISIHNFRPNIVVEGENAPPYAEDNWKWMKIGDVILYLARPCLRCSVPTINPNTGVRYPKTEPVTTLNGYRRLKDLMNINIDGSLPIMGNNMGLLKVGHISVGDTVYVGK